MRLDDPDRPQNAGRPQILLHNGKPCGLLPNPVLVFGPKDSVLIQLWLELEMGQYGVRQTRVPFEMMGDWAQAWIENPEEVLLVDFNYVPQIFSTKAKNPEPSAQGKPTLTLGDLDRLLD